MFMGAQPTPTPTPAGPAAPATADAPPYGDLLDLIFDVSKDVLRHVQACTLAETGRPAPDTEADAAPRARAALDLATALDRVALAIRKTILLAERLKTAPIVAARQRTADRKCILRHVEDAIVKQDKRPGDSEVLNAELLERLDSPDLEDEIGNRPVAEIIQEICRDLGLNGFRG